MTIKKILYILIFIPFFSFASTNLPQRSDTIIWTGNVELNTDLFFSNTQTLKILPGTIVTASGAFKIEIRGNIIAEGTAENPILFTATDTLGLYDSATIAGGWHGIHLLNNTNGFGKFTYCRFHYGKANIPGSWYAMKVFHDTLSGNQGGAFRIINYQSVEFDHCTFFYNYSRTYGGAIYCNDIQSIKITDCEFLQNKTMFRGGCIYANNQDSLLITNTTFRNNIALFYFLDIQGWRVYVSDGSAICLITDYPNYSMNTVSSCTFFNNESITTACFWVPQVNFYNNLLTNNYNLKTLFFGRLPSTNQVFNNIIANNYFEVSIPGVYTVSEDMHFFNNILWNNFSLAIEDDDMAVQWQYNEPHVSYSLIWEGRSVGDNIITDDPLFVNPAPGYGLESNGWEYDWSLSNASPAVNTGTPDTTGLNLPELDIAGNPRIYGTRIDMGAYENQVVVGLPKNPLVNAKLEIIPNPFTDKFSINLLAENKINRISVMNQSGITIRNMESLPQDGFMVIDLNTFPSGLYLVVVEYADGTRKVEKVLKQ